MNLNGAKGNKKTQLKMSGENNSEEHIPLG